MAKFIRELGHRLLCPQSEEADDCSLGDPPVVKIFVFIEWFLSFLSVMLFHGNLIEVALNLRAVASMRQEVASS